MASLPRKTMLVLAQTVCLLLLLLRVECSSTSNDVDYRHLTLDFNQPIPSATPRLRIRKSTNILVTGGAGYIGSTMVQLLLEQNIYTVVVVDNLSRGWPANVDTLRLSGLEYFYNFDLSDTEQLATIMRRHRISVVIHFAANAFASESVDRPLLYFHNITQNTLSVAEAMESAGVHVLVYSSSCATYGNIESRYMPVAETTPQLPVSPYGVAKKAGEDLLLSAFDANRQRKVPFRLALLRYFNVIGADPSQRIGPALRPELRHYQRVTEPCLDQQPAFTTHHSPLTTYHLPLSTCHLPLTTYHLPPATYHVLVPLR